MQLSLKLRQTKLGAVYKYSSPVRVLYCSALFVGSLLCSSGAGGDSGDCPELGAAFDPSDLRASGEGGDLAAECAGEHQVINVVPLLSFSMITSSCLLVWGVTAVAECSNKMGNWRNKTYLPWYPSRS